MIHISVISDADADNYDYVKCPVCKTRLCDKPKGSAVSILQIHGKAMEHVVVKCRKCGSRFLISTCE